MKGGGGPYDCHFTCSGAYVRLSIFEKKIFTEVVLLHTTRFRQQQQQQLRVSIFWRGICPQGFGNEKFWFHSFDIPYKHIPVKKWTGSQVTGWWHRTTHKFQVQKVSIQGTGWEWNTEEREGKWWGKEARSSSSKRRRVKLHKLLKLPYRRGKWDGTKFRKIHQPYQRYQCIMKCVKFTRQYFRCYKAHSVINCINHSIHNVELISPIKILIFSILRLTTTLWIFNILHIPPLDNGSNDAYI